MQHPPREHVHPVEVEVIEATGFEDERLAHLVQAHVVALHGHSASIYCAQWAYGDRPQSSNIMQPAVIAQYQPTRQRT